MDGSPITDFATCFEYLTGYRPFPWQIELFEEWLSKGKFPHSCNLPTGLGKTSVVAIWLIALMNQPEKVPRRLVYVVNRRTVVDQTTDEVEKLRKNLGNLKNVPSHARQLSISTLRGQFADNREWSADPSRAAVICGTVDMIGSRLLFSGYGVGFKTKPLHAGFLGQDVLLVHDEAHLEPAFQELLVAIEKEQRVGERSEEKPWPNLRVMELTATSRGSGGNGHTEKPFELTCDERNVPAVIPDTPTKPIHHVWRRLKAKKEIRFHPASPEKGAVAKRIASCAADYKDRQCAVLIFVRTLDDVDIVKKDLARTECPIILLTGTIRGKERDDLVQTSAFKRFLKGATPGDTTYMVCTSAGEVGIDISADHMVCDLSPFDSLAQRLGRVNRFGDGDAKIDVVYPTAFEKDKLSAAREKTLALLRELPQLPDSADESTRYYDASPNALSNLRKRTDLPSGIENALTPTPTILPVTDILFDSWALTTIRGKLPGWPPVEPYLHGISEWQPPETQVAWREEVRVIDALLERYEPKDLLDLLEAYPLKPHELLRDRSDRVFTQLQLLANEHPNAPVWIVSQRDEVVPSTLQKLTAGAKKAIEYATVLLPPLVGGLTASGMLEGSAAQKKPDAEKEENTDQPTDANKGIRYDVADEWYKDKERAVKRRVRLWDDDDVPDGMRWVCTIDVAPDDEDEQPSARRFWHWYELIKTGDTEGSKASRKPILWDHHTADITERAEQIGTALNLPSELMQAVTLAAKYHDLGKKREVWQRSIGNPNPTDWHAKSGKDPLTGRLWRPRDICPNYRHEFGSLLDLLDEKHPDHMKLTKLSHEMRELVLHLVAAHHGRGRPHFPTGEAFDLERNSQVADALAIETPRRFARLQRKYGRWGLAYLESLVRAADYAASANPVNRAPATIKLEDQR